MTLAADLGRLAEPTDPPPHLEATGGWKITLTSSTAELQTEQTEQHLVAADDWDGILKHFGLNPAEFRIVDDTVRMSSWQQSKRLENGDRDTITLYSYRARFARISNRLAAGDLDAALARVRKWKPLIRRTPGAGLGEPCTFYMGGSDWQIGKDGTLGEGGTVGRVLDSFELGVARLKELRKIGRNIESVALWNPGDVTEGCDGNYASQLFTVEMTRREQLNMVLDLWLAWLRAFAPLADDIEFGSALSNHGEWTRQGPGTKAVTSDSDNVDGFLADALQQIVSGREDLAHVRFTIPGSEMVVPTSMSGVPVAVTHGHKTPGGKAEEDWLAAQSIRLLREHGTEPRLWLTAHRHHLDVRDFGPYYRLQHPALDSGSKWYTDATGKWSTPGTLTCLVGRHKQTTRDRVFSDLSVLL